VKDSKTPIKYLHFVGRKGAGWGAAFTLLIMLMYAGCAQEVALPELDLASAEANIRIHDLGGETYNDMVRVLNLDPGAMDALQMAFAERDEAVEQWLSGEKGQRLIQVEAEMVAAVEARNLEEVKRCTAAGRPLREEMCQLIEDHEAAILNTLTPDQQVAWQGYEVANKMLVLMTPLNLEIDQVQTIEGAGMPAVVQAMNQGQPNPKAAAFLALERWAEESVLYPEQREAYQDIKADHKLRSLSL